VHNAARCRILPNDVDLSIIRAEARRDFFQRDPGEPGEQAAFGWLRGRTANSLMMSDFEIVPQGQGSDGRSSGKSMILSDKEESNNGYHGLDTRLGFCGDDLGPADPFPTNDDYSACAWRLA